LVTNLIDGRLVPIGDTSLHVVERGAGYSPPPDIGETYADLMVK